MDINTLSVSRSAWCIVTRNDNRVSVHHGKMLYHDSHQIWSMTFFLLCHISHLKCTRFIFGWGYAPDPAGEAHIAPKIPYLNLGRGGKGGLYSVIVLFERSTMNTFNTCSPTAVMTVRAAQYMSHAVLYIRKLALNSVTCIYTYHITVTVSLHNLLEMTALCTKTYSWRLSQWSIPVSITSYTKTELADVSVYQHCVWTSDKHVVSALSPITDRQLHGLRSGRFGGHI